MLNFYFYQNALEELRFGVSLWIKQSVLLLPVFQTGKLDSVKNILCVSDDDKNNNDNF